MKVTRATSPLSLLSKLRSTPQPSLPPSTRTSFGLADSTIMSTVFAQTHVLDAMQSRKGNSARLCLTLFNECNAHHISCSLLQGYSFIAPSVLFTDNLFTALDSQLHCGVASCQALRVSHYLPLPSLPSLPPFPTYPLFSLFL